jgi:uncharacterized integral membrane protein
MTTTPTFEEQITAAGLTYGRRHDIAYRIGFVIQVLGAAILAVLYPLENPFYTIGLMLFELGVLLSAAYVLVGMRPIKKIIVGSVIIGLALQIAGSFVAPEQYAGSILLVGTGLICIGAGGLAGKEAYCFGYREGWMLMIIGYPFMVLINLFGKGNLVVNSLGFSAVFLLILSLTGKKLQQKLLSPCSATVRGISGKP